MELRAAVTINAPAHAAWEVVGERFGQIGEWATPIIASSLEGEPSLGAIRICQVARFGPFRAGVIHEQLVDFDPAAMTLSYKSTAGLPAFVRSAVNNWSVHPDSAATCIVRTHATLELRGPVRLLSFFVTRKLQAEAARVLDELRHQVEYGRPHPRKLAAGVE